MSKKPRFFCDNCNTEVDRNANSCSRCGRFFASVRCPKCGFSGDENSFKNGCSACGYSAQPANIIRPAEKKIPAGKLPVWVYVFSVCAFLIVFAVLVFILVR